MKGDTATMTLLPRGQDFRYRQGDFREIAPGVFECAAPPDLAPKWGLVQWKPAQGGLWAPVIRAMSALIGHAEWRAEVLGTSWSTVKRLALAGFVQSIQAGPKVRSIVLDSYFEHLRAVQREPDFWTPERIARYNATYAAEADEDEAEPPPDSGPELFANPAVLTGGCTRPAPGTLPGGENAPETIRRGSRPPSLQPA